MSRSQTRDPRAPFRDLIRDTTEERNLRHSRLAQRLATGARGSSAGAVRGGIPTPVDSIAKGGNPANPGTPDPSNPDIPVFTSFAFMLDEDSLDDESRHLA